MVSVQTVIFPMRKLGAIGPFLAQQAAKGFLPLVSTYIPTSDGAGGLFMVLAGADGEDSRTEKTGGNGATDRPLPAPEVVTQK